MLSKKQSGLFVEVGDFSVLVAQVNSLEAPLEISSLKSFQRTEDLSHLQAFAAPLVERKTPRFLMAHCGILPPSRFIRRHSIESAAKAKDPKYLEEVVTQQFRMDARLNKTAVISAVDGAEFSLDRPITAQKELLFAGAKTVEISGMQSLLVKSHIYPRSLQLAPVSSLGAMQDYLRWKKYEEPVLIVDIGRKSGHAYIVSRNQVDFTRPLEVGIDSVVPQIQSELGLKDEESARKLLNSNTFDFTEMGSALLRKVLKELQAAIGFFEVQTGLGLTHIHVLNVPDNLQWVPNTLAKSLGHQLLPMDLVPWLNARDIRLAPEVAAIGAESRWFGLYSLMGNFSSKGDGAKEK